MEIKKLNNFENISKTNRVQREFDSFKILIEELKSRKLPNNTIEKINEIIDKFNSFNKKANRFSSEITNSTYKIVQIVLKEHKLTPINYNRNMWMGLGIAIFGLPLGVAMGFALGNVAFIGIGLPLGMSIGLAIGASIDKKAKENGNQLNIEL